MGAYNIVNPANLQAGQLENVGDVMANLQAIQAIINGGIDNTNINAAAAILASKLAGYPASGAQVLAGDGTWKTVPKVTTSTFAGGPPGGPVDGDIWIATAVDGNATRWAFSYNNTNGRWQFIGGSAINIVDNGGWAIVNSAGVINQTRTTTTLSRGGLYEVVSGSFNGLVGAAGAGTFSLGIMVNAVLQAVLGIVSQAASNYFNVSAVPLTFGYTGGQTIGLTYGANAAGTNGNASISVQPIYVT